MKKAIGLLGGTFDPIHEAHLRIAEHVLTTFELEYVTFIPCYQPPHREQTIASAADRLAMVKLAVQDNQKFRVNDIEIKRQGVSYMIDTLMALRKEIPDQPFCLILGADAFAKFNTWHQWEKILELTNLIILNRDDQQTMQPDWMQDFLKDKETEKKEMVTHTRNGHIYFDTITPIPISATKIRAQIKAGEQNIKGLSPAVLKYIEQHQLFL